MYPQFQTAVGTLLIFQIKFENGMDFKFTWTDYCQLVRKRTLDNHENLSGHRSLTIMELGTTDPMTGDKKTFFFYPLLAISPKTYHDLITISNMAAKKIKKYHVTMTYVGHLV